MPIISGIRYLVESYKYAYPSARAKALKSFLLTPESINQIKEAKDLKKALNILLESVYGPVIAGKRNIIDIEIALIQDLSDSLVKILEILPKRTKNIFRLYLGKYEIDYIKSILACVNVGFIKNEIEEPNLPVNITLEAYQHAKISSANTVEEVIAGLSDTIYFENLIQSCKEYSENGSLLPLYSALDKSLFQRLLEMVLLTPGEDVRSLRSLIRIEIDLLNLKSVFRLKASGSTSEEVLDYLIPDGYRLSEHMLKEISLAKDVQEILKKLEKTMYYEPLSKAVKGFDEEQKEIDLQAIEIALDRLYADIGEALCGDFPLGIGPILGYVIAKTREVKELIRILKLKDEGFTRNEIDSISGEL